MLKVKQLTLSNNGAYHMPNLTNLSTFFPSLLHLDLSSNKILSIDVDVLVQTFPNIVTLDVRRNLIRDFD
jgi:Leucine-rich repeat (LRR) protein